MDGWMDGERERERARERELDRWRERERAIQRQGRKCMKERWQRGGNVETTCMSVTGNALCRHTCMFICAVIVKNTLDATHCRQQYKL